MKMNLKQEKIGATTRIRPGNPRRKRGIFPTKLWLHGSRSRNLTCGDRGYEPDLNTILPAILLFTDGIQNPNKRNAIN